ncbi:DUF4328 domain-containing protein [Sphingomonas aquatilis]|uniref:DUF4328 domain-containing protein n=1 Tax=Sphingomonas aquatilis TaxID=93063 RepID=A0AAW3TS38_9SPHN|nr:DUF4328 domain-containing protein [Sphingomonas aquatilis]MBB3875511.1 hypothetical protein [Sphingomonas aquatilis]MCI4654765.1 DUF4328 domain-containing protein [Sphingomonas aquatilis]GEM72813.1 hypothetical protein SAQ01S_25790 [Sphingomonas aquatilis NBRC 16722]
MDIAAAPKTGAKATVAWLWIWLACQAAVAAYAVFALSTVAALGGTPSPDHLAQAAPVGEAIGSVAILVHLVTIVLVLRWVYRAAVRAHALSDRIAVSPGWAVGRFFLPVLNLWRPFRGMVDIWRTSIDPVAPHTVPVPALLRWWWGLWLLANLFGPIGGTLMDEAHRASHLAAARWADVALLAIDVPLVILMVRIVRQVSARQAALLTQRGTTAR